MSVQSWRRKLSKTEFLYYIFNLNIAIGHIIGGTPKKYLTNYGDQLVQSAAEALKHAQTANDVFVNDEASFQFRKQELESAIGCLDNVCTMSYIFLEIVRKHDGLSIEKRNKILKWEDQVGFDVDQAVKLVNGVIRSDRKRWQEKGNPDQTVVSTADTR